MNGRWPANVILSPEMAEVLNEQTKGTRAAKPSGTHVRRNTFAGNNAIGLGLKPIDYVSTHEDTAGASRFFLQAGYEQWELEWILANGLVPCMGAVYHGT